MSVPHVFIKPFGNTNAFHRGRLDAEDFYAAWNSGPFSSTFDSANFVCIGDYTTQNSFETCDYAEYRSCPFV